MLKTLLWSLLTLGLSLVLTELTPAQEKTVKTEGQPIRRTLTFDSKGGVFMIPEVGAVVIDQDGKLVVEMVAPSDQRPKGYESINLKKGDLLIMANGKKLATPKDAQALYDSLNIGEDLKLGIRRGEDMLIATIKKGDPDKMPRRRMMIATGDGDAKGSWESGNGQQHAIKIDDDAKDITPVMDAGIIVGIKNDKLTVVDVMPHAKEILGDAAIAQGDVILALQDKPVKTTADFTDAFEAIKVGEPVSITVFHEGKELKASFTKTESQFRTVIRKN